MNPETIMESLRAFHINGVNNLIYSFTTNWCLVLLVIAAVISVVVAVQDESAGVVHEEQNIL